MAVGFSKSLEGTAINDKDGRAGTRAKPQGCQCRDKAEGSRPIAVGRGADLMQRAASEAGSGEAAIDLRDAKRQMLERQAGRSAFQARHDAP